MFGAPLWLLGVMAGAAPIIIHFLNRQRFKRQIWAAMEWLLKALERNRRRMRVENLILLAIRVLILVLLAIALARPVLDSRGALAAAGGARLCRIIILDNSYSMGVKLDEGMPFERAKKAAAELMETAAGGDVACLVVTGADSAEAIPEPTSNLAQLREEIETTQLSHTDADLRAVLLRVVKAAKKFTHPRIHVTVFTDMQRRSWYAGGAVGTEGDDLLVRELEEIKRTVAVFMVDCGAEASNTAVENLIVSADAEGDSQGLVAANVPVTVRATLEHFAAEPRQKVNVRLLVDGRVEKAQEVDLPAREPVPVLFTGVRFDKPGVRVLRVEADGDALALDDSREMAVDVDAAVKVLCVDGAPSQDVVTSGAYYVERALAPQEFEFAPGSSVFSAKAMSEVDFVTEDLSPYRLVVLVNVFRVPEAKLKQLERFVQSGGGLLIFLGGRIETGDYNTALWKDGKGLLPARILERKSHPSFSGEYARFDARDSEHEVAVALAQRNVDLNVARVREYYYLETRADDPTVSVLCRYDNRDATPAIVERRFGQGTVVLISTSAQRDWSTWPLSPSFLPFVQEVAAYAARGASAGRNLLVGEPIRVTLSGSDFGSTVSVTTPAKERIEDQPAPEGDDYLFDFDETRVAGIYTVDFDGAKGTAEYCVMPDGREGDLRRITAGELEDVLGPGAFVLIDNPDRLGAQMAAMSTGASMWKSLVFVVLGLLLAEALLARMFGCRRGLVKGR